MGQEYLFPLFLRKQWKEEKKKELEKELEGACNQSSPLQNPVVLQSARYCIFQGKRQAMPIKCVFLLQRNGVSKGSF